MAKADTLCDRSFETIEQIYGDIAKGPRTYVLTNDDASIQLVDRHELVIWTFLKAAHPASPAVICQTPVKEDGHLMLLLQARCGGPKASCDALIAEFEAHQTETAERIAKSASSPKP